MISLIPKARKELIKTAQNECERFQEVDAIFDAISRRSILR